MVKKLNKKQLHKTKGGAEHDPLGKNLPESEDLENITITPTPTQKVDTLEELRRKLKDKM